MVKMGAGTVIAITIWILGSLLTALNSTAPLRIIIYHLVDKGSLKQYNQL
jgi:hypothetical protein